jgi:hypothetical protein
MISIIKLWDGKSLMFQMGRLIFKNPSSQAHK